MFEDSLITTILKNQQKSFEHMKNMDMLVSEISYILGYDLEELKRRLAAGWTLEPPKKNNMSLKEIADYVRFNGTSK